MCCVRNEVARPRDCLQTQPHRRPLSRDPILSISIHNLHDAVCRLSETSCWTMAASQTYTFPVLSFRARLRVFVFLPRSSQHFMQTILPDLKYQLSVPLPFCDCTIPSLNQSILLPRQFIQIQHGPVTLYCSAPPQFLSLQHLEAGCQSQPFTTTKTGKVSVASLFTLSVQRRLTLIIGRP